MQLALLTGAIPRTCARGPKVRLQRGYWRLNCQGLVDSILSLTVFRRDDDYIYPIIRDREIIIHDEFAIVQVNFEERGNEQHISIFATLEKQVA